MVEWKYAMCRHPWRHCWRKCCDYFNAAKINKFSRGFKLLRVFTSVWCSLFVACECLSMGRKVDFLCFLGKQSRSKLSSTSVYMRFKCSLCVKVCEVEVLSDLSLSWCPFYMFILIAFEIYFSHPQHSLLELTSFGRICEKKKSLSLSRLRLQKNTDEKSCK